MAAVVVLSAERGSQTPIRSVIMIKYSKLAVLAVVTAVVVASPALAQSRNARQQGDQSRNGQAAATQQAPESASCRAGFWGACSK
jgi:hypothetical protein